MMKKAFLKGIALATAAAVTVSTSAFAGVTTTQVLAVSYVNVTSTVQQLLIMDTFNANLVAQVGAGSGCSNIPTTSIDTVKIWQSMAQAALLSGKTLTFTWTDCGTAHYLTRLDLNP